MESFLDAATLRTADSKVDAGAEFEWVVDIHQLPSEVQAKVLSMLPTYSLAPAKRCCASWHHHVEVIIEYRLRHWVQQWTSKGRQTCDAPCPNPLRFLYAVETLQSCIGPWPDHSWRDEWPKVRLAQARHLAATKGHGRVQALEEELAMMGGAEAALSFFSTGAGSIRAECEQSYARAKAFKREHGWDDESATEVSLLASRCSGALAQAIAQRRSEFAACCWTLALALWERSWQEASMHALPAAAGAVEGRLPPPCYASLDGEFGLQSDDAAWVALRSPGAAPGLRFVTSGFPFAMEANEQSFPNRGFPNGGGFHTPITGNGMVKYELADSDAVVCFHSSLASVAAPTDEHGSALSTATAFGRCRALISTDPSIWRLPPFATVTLRGVREPGTWSVRGMPMSQRCFDCTVDF